jgi:hypothetical protein
MRLFNIASLAPKISFIGPKQAHIYCSFQKSQFINLARPYSRYFLSLDWLTRTPTSQATVVTK